MADIVQSESNSGKHHKPRSKKIPIRVDMTPMVDLAFLLISFFMLTTVLSQEHVISLDKRIDTTNKPVGDCRVLNILIDSTGTLYSYNGIEIENLQESSFSRTTGIRKVIEDKTKEVKAKCGVDRNGTPYELICLIKMLPGTRYQSMVSIMDEMNITGTKCYSLQEPNEDEIAMVSKKEQFLSLKN